MGANCAGPKPACFAAPKIFFLSPLSLLCSLASNSSLACFCFSAVIFLSISKDPNLLRPIFSPSSSAIVRLILALSSSFSFSSVSNDNPSSNIAIFRFSAFKIESWVSFIERLISSSVLLSATLVSMTTTSSLISSTKSPAICFVPSVPSSCSFSCLPISSFQPFCSMIFSLVSPIIFLINS